MGLDHLGNGGKVLADGVVAAALADLEGDERGDGITDRGGVDRRTPSGDRPRPLEPTQPRLDCSPCDAELARRLEDTDPRMVGEQSEKGGVEGIDRHRAHHLT